MEAVADRGNAICAGGRNAGRALGLYQRRRPAETVLYQLVQEHLETFLTLSDDGAGEVITEAPTVRAILTHLGEPSEAPPISPCRGPPEWEMLDQTAEFDPVHPEPEYDFDQSIGW